MDILFKSERLRRKLCDVQKACMKWGPDKAARIGQRLDELSSVENLEEMLMLPGRCHELHGDLKGQLSLDLTRTGAERLIFEPADEPVPEKPDGGLYWSKVTAVRILRVGDTHG